MGKTTAVRRALGLAGVSLAVLLLALAVMLMGQWRVEPLAPLSGPPAPATQQTLERGAYLALAGNCAGCHTARGGAAYAGGRAIDTPFGAVFAGNLTPDATGLGAWSSEAFWRALTQGQSRDGRLLYPAFPYEHFSLLTRDDSDALYAWLRQLPPVAQANRPHALRWPYNSQAALAVWRELYFKPQAFAPDAAQSAEWNRGAYLVRGLAHCAACHSPRDALGGRDAANEFGGGQMPGQAWYAPSLRSTAEAGMAQQAHMFTLLKTGVAPGASALGPMAEVVFQSTQHLLEPDLRAMSAYLHSRLDPVAAPAAPAAAAKASQLELGAELYQQHCADCHGTSGEGAADAYPALAGNRSLLMSSSANTVMAILSGGFAPATAGHPRPYGMPPFRTLLNDTEVAALTSFIRQSWGNQAGAVSALDVQRAR